MLTLTLNGPGEKVVLDTVDVDVTTDGLSNSCSPVNLGPSARVSDLPERVSV